MARKLAIVFNDAMILMKKRHGSAQPNQKNGESGMKRNSATK
jgi:hypothetical protein